jgi:hypothetical protein
MEKKKPEKMLIEKRNVLNEMRSSHLTLQESRFLCIYLAKINPRNPEATRRVRFPLKDFAQIMDITGSFTSTYIKNVTDSLLQKIVSVPDSKGGFTSFQLFKRCRVTRENVETDEWFVEIDAHDEALPLMFDIQDRYMTYELWNVLILKSVNQIRMYEILKQYEKIGERTLKLETLKELIGIKKTEYKQFQDFKTKVINVCQQALKEHTDIKFEWEVSKRGQRGKILELKFFIYKNDEYQDISNLDFYLKNYAYQELPCSETINEKPINPVSSTSNKSDVKTKDSKSDIEIAQNHKFWRYAIEIAHRNKNVNNPVPYAAKIVFSWLSKEYQNTNDLIQAGEIDGEVPSYDLDPVMELF